MEHVVFFYDLLFNAHGLDIKVPLNPSELLKLGQLILELFLFFVLT